MPFPNMWRIPQDNWRVPLHDSVTRRRATLTQTGYGNDTRDWTNATTVTYPAEVQPATTTENIVDQQQVTTHWLMFLPPDADVIATDRIEWDDGAGTASYDIDGDIRRWDVLGTPSHLEAALVRVDQGA